MPELSTYAHAIPVTTPGGHTFLLVTRRPLAECANDMVRSAAAVLQRHPDLGPVDSEVVTRRSHGSTKQVAPVTTPA